MLNRHPRADPSTSPRTCRKEATGDRSDPIVTTAASSHADTAIAGQEQPPRQPRAATTTAASSQHAPRRVQRNRVRRQNPGQPREGPPHPARRGAEPAQPVPHRVRRNPRRGRDRPEPLPPGRPHEHVPHHPRPRRTAATAATPEAGPCVAPHDPHRARRGRTATGNRPAVKTLRRAAWPHPPSRPPQPGHESRPLPTSSSTTAALLPTVSTGASEHPHGPPRLREKVTGRAVPYPTCSRCRRTPPSRNRNHHENTPTSNDATTPMTLTRNGG